MGLQILGYATMNRGDDQAHSQ